MQILILGSGGREHVLADAYAKSKKVKNIFVLPGNPFIEFSNKKVKCLPDFKVTDFDAILRVVKKYRVDLVDVAQDDPLALGFVDKFTNLGIKAFGPTKAAAEIEWSKDWSRNFMVKYKLPIPRFESFENTSKAIAYISKMPEQTLFIKASGLALGKGAIKVETKAEAISAVKSMKNFGNAGNTFLIEKAMMGEEFSAFAICDGENLEILGFAQDHKTVFNHDMGPNTGGMGAISNPSVVNAKITKEVEEIFGKFIKGMIEEGRPYFGIIYLGAMLTKNGVKIVEFNSRWGDPEAEVLIPSISTDYLSLVESALNKKLIKVKTDDLKRISITGASLGYPGNYSTVKGKRIFGLNRVRDVKVFGAGISKKGKDFVVNGGRVFHLMAKGKDIFEVRKKAYGAIATINIEGNNLHYRTDIGLRDLENGQK